MAQTTPSQTSLALSDADDLLIVLLEKPSMRRALTPVLVSVLPDLRPRVRQVLYLSLHALRTGRLAWPRGIPMRDLPLIMPAAVREIGEEDWSPWILDPKTGGEAPVGVGLDPKALLAGCPADHLLVFVDPDHSGQLVAHDALRAFGRDDLLMPGVRGVPSVVSMNWDSHALTVASGQALAGETMFGGATPLLAAGLVKRHFDYNWGLNARAILGQSLEAAGLAPTEVMSKNMLLTLHALVRDDQPRTEGDLVQFMSAWTGTGKYQNHRHGDLYAGIGSPMSRGEICQLLIRLGLLEEQADERADLEALVDHLEERGTSLADRNPAVGDLLKDAVTSVRQAASRRRRYRVSTAGRRLVDRLLHKDTYDPDLPFRLQGWMDDAANLATGMHVGGEPGGAMSVAEAAAAAVQPTVDRYLRTLFGKQKRHLGKVA